MTRVARALGAVGLVGLVVSCARPMPSASEGAPYRPVGYPTPGVGPSASATQAAGASQASASPTAKPTASAKGARPVVLARVASSAPLFSDELRRLQSAAVEAIGKDPKYVPVPLEELDAIDALVTAGKTRADGPKCRLAPKKSELVWRRFQPQHATGAQLWASCTGDECHSQIDVGDALSPFNEYTDNDVKFRLFGRVSQPNEIESWVKGLRGDDAQTIPNDRSPGVGGFGRGFVIGNGPLEVAYVDTPVGFTTPPTPATFPKSLFAKCASGEMYEAVIAVDKAGAVSRCEPAGCVCNGLSKVRLDPGQDNRRARLTILGSGGTFGLGLGSGRSAGRSAARRRHALVRVTPTVDNEIDRRPAEDALRECFGADASPTNFELSVELGNDGSVTAASAKGTAGNGSSGEISDTEKKCVETAAKRFAFTCPEPGSTHTSVGVEVRAYRGLAK